MPTNTIASSINKWIKSVWKSHFRVFKVFKFLKFHESMKKYQTEIMLSQ